MTAALTRENWLLAAGAFLRERVFNPAGIEVPRFQVSVGWPAGKGTRSDTVGQCFNAAWNEQGEPSIFISPALKDPLEILGCLTHEMIHAWDDCAHLHRGPFVQTFRKIGMVGKATECAYGEELEKIFKEIVKLLGKYPHGRLSAGHKVEAPTRDTNRQLLAACAERPDGVDIKQIYKVRMTRKWMDEVGMPICPCHGVEMTEA